MGGETGRQRVRCFQDLVVWRKAHEFTLQVYQHPAAYPKTETYGLVAQFRSAAVSIPANIAEGFKKRSAADKRRFMNIAQGSLEECRYYLILARHLGYGEDATLTDLAEQVARLLQAYYTSIH